MMRLKKLVALLLTAVMALAMLTACGGGGGGKSPTEKERYLSGINARLSEQVPGAKKLTLEEDTKKTKASLYKDKCENQVNFNDSDAKQNAGIDNEQQYIAFRLKLTKKDEEKVKIKAIADKIYDTMQEETGTNALKKNEYKLDYAWGKTTDKDATIFVYVVLRKVS